MDPTCPVLRRREWLMLAAGVLLLPPAEAVHQRQSVFGSPADLLLPPEAGVAAAAAVWQGLQSMNSRWNAWKPGEVLNLNRAFAEGRALRASPALIALIEGARALERRSFGCFNAGIGGLVGRWGFHEDELRPGARPKPEDLRMWLQAGPSLSQIERRGNLLRSRNPSLRLDFGGYAKGVALDWALDRLQGAGVGDGLLNLGGNLAAMGGAQGRPWRVAVRDPFGPGVLATLETQGREAVVTSGTYERFRVLDGQAFGHVIDPRSGQASAGLVSVTVVHPSAALADAAATALLVAGPQAWPQVAQGLGVDQVLVVDGHGRRQATPRLAPRLRWQG